MKTLVFNFFHNCVAHPLLFLSCDAQWAERFHDWTAAQAWPEEHRAAK